MERESPITAGSSSKFTQHRSARRKLLTGFLRLAYGPTNVRKQAVMPQELNPTVSAPHSPLERSAERWYVCPGETEPISFAVHLSRLARFYPACQTCPLRCETGATPQPGIERLQHKHAREQAEVQRTFGRVRGVYLNQIDRRVAGDIVGQFAARLWNDIHRAVQTHRRERIGDWTAPSIAIGYDQRTSSPDIMTGVQDRLRLMGCDVIDLGLTTGPALQYAIRFHQTSSGIFVSGSGFSPAWTGLDFFDANALPADVDALPIPRAGSTPMKHARPVRVSGQHTFTPIDHDYALRLRRFVRPQRPMRVCVGVEDRVAREHVEAVMRPLGDGLRLVQLPKRPRDLSDPSDSDIQNVANAVLEFEADMGFVIDEDMRHCALIDNFGELALPEEVANVLCEEPTFVSGGDEAFRHKLAASRRQSESGVLCGTAMYAFPSQSIALDAVLTLAHFVTRFSQQEKSVAEFVAGQYENRK